jgi:hypothetical protein
MKHWQSSVDDIRKDTLVFTKHSTGSDSGTTVYTLRATWRGGTNSVASAQRATVPELGARAPCKGMTGHRLRGSPSTLPEERERKVLLPDCHALLHKLAEDIRWPPTKRHQPWQKPWWKTSSSASGSRKLHSDYNLSFKSRLIQEMLQRLRLSKTRTTPLHPQSQGTRGRSSRRAREIMTRGYAFPAVITSIIPRNQRLDAPSSMVFGM